MSVTVLIVDDHPSFRASARTLLESEGYEVIGEAEVGAGRVLDALRSTNVERLPANEAQARELAPLLDEPERLQEAWAEVVDLHPDLVLLDIQLPDLDGFEVAERLKELDERPAVVLTSSRDGKDYKRCIECSGARGFVPKAELSGAALSALLT